MYTGKLDQPTVPSDYDHTFFARYSAIVDLYAIVDGKPQMRLKDGKVFFTTQKKNFDFFVAVHSLDSTKADDKYLFPVDPKMHAVCEIVSENKTVTFSWDAGDNLQVMIEFHIRNEDFDEAIKFRNVLIRLIYQAAHHRSFSTCTNPDEYEQYCKFKDQSAQPKTPPVVLEVFQQLSKDMSVQFGAIGELMSLDPNQPNSKPFLISSHYILLVRTTGQHSFDLEIHDEHKKKVYEKKVDTDLKYNISQDTNTLNWLDVRANQLVYLAFKFRDDQAANNVQVILSMCMLQSQQKKNFDDIVKDSDWNQYYGNHNMEEEETMAMPEYNGYIDERRQGVDFAPANTFVEPKSFNDIKVSTLAQGKTIDRSFVTQDNNISVYQALDDDQFHFICNLPPVKTFDGHALKPSKLMLTEQDTRALMLGEAGDNKVYYMDLEKGKIISELSGANVTGIKDISNYEKNSDMTTNPLLFGVNDRNLFQMDPRVKESVVAERPYASNYMFNTIAGAKDGSFVVGSADGAIRLYNKCAGNAKNLLPSLLGEAILHLDTSKDGAFILATCRSHVMLIPTFQEGKSGFNNTFRKDNKPRPIILKVSAKSLQKLNIKEINYSYAIFDNKNQKETLIAANAGPYLILWDLSKVLSGKHESTTIKSLGDTIIQDQFKYNTDKLIAALPNKLVCQSAKVAKR